jgi:type II secretory pathway pseudopilin PulG
MKLFKNKKGYTEAELMMVFALIALFGILCFTLIEAGGGAYERLAENRSSKSYARVALSYIENRVRQGDGGQSVMIAESPLDEDESALVITGITGIEDEELWILQNGGELVEYYLAKGQELDPASYFTIADIESFDVEVVGSTLQLTIGYLQNSEVKTQSSMILLRSKGGGGYE